MAAVAVQRVEGTKESRKKARCARSRDSSDGGSPSLIFTFEKENKTDFAVKAKERRGTNARGRTGGKRGAENSIWSDEASHVTLNLDLTSSAGSGDGGGGDGGGGGELGVLGAAVRGAVGVRLVWARFDTPSGRQSARIRRSASRLPRWRARCLAQSSSLSVIGEGRPR